MKLYPLSFFSLVALLSLHSVQATKTFGSRAGTSGFTFNFNANKVVTSGLGPAPTSFYAARTDATTTDETAAPFAVAGVLESGGGFVPMCLQPMRLNGIDGQTNPLYGQQISLLGAYSGTPLVVRADDPTYLYWIFTGVDAPFSGASSSPQLKDAQGASGSDGSVTAGIVQLVGGGYAYCAVKKNGGTTFGEVGSGVAVCQVLVGGITQLPAVAGDTGIKATPLDISSSSIKITTNAASLSNTILDMYWDSSLQRLYVCFKATGAAGASDGVRGVVVGYISNGTLTFYSFAPASAFTGTNYIVGGVGSSTVTTIYKFRPMFTSTSLNYGIVLGNADDEATAQTTVYAVPLVNKNVYGAGLSVDDTTQGVLASKDTNVGTNLKTFYTTSNGVSYFTGRGFQTPATVTADLTAKTDRAAVVGGGVAPGTVTDMVAYKDAVFVSTSDAVTQSIGIFYSQALFDGDGAIKSWTPWQRCYTSNDPSYKIYGMGYQGSYGQFFTAEGASSGAVKTFKTTVFSNGEADGILGGTTSSASVGLLSLVKTLFADIPAGVQMTDVFPSNCSAFSQTANQKLSVMTFSGYKQLVIAQTGLQADGIFTPTIGDFDTGKRTYTGGAINTAMAADTQFISVTGGALDTIGSINSTTMLNDGNYGYLVVGGVGGVAVLKNGSGAGWATAGLQKFFSNIGTDKSFVMVGNYQNVRKVWADGTNLYVLTNTQLDRIPAGQLAVASPTAYTVATLSSLGLSVDASFSDVFTSGKLAFLATSYGLYRSVNGTDFSTATVALSSLWTSVTLTDAPFSVTRLYAVSATGLPYDAAKQAGGGNLYVLAASVATGLSATYRIALSDASSGAVTNSTVQLFPDYIIQNSNTGFIQWGEYRNYQTTDGSRVYAQRAAYLGALPLVEDAPLATSGKSYGQRGRHTLPFTFTGYTALTPMVRTETGSMLVAGDNGLQVLE